MVLTIYSGASNISRSSDFNSILDGIAGNGVHNGMAVSANGTGLGVNVAAGAYTANGTKVQYAGATPAVTLDAADGANPRYDIITADSAGTIAFVKGTASATPAYPDIPAGKVRLAIIRVTAGLVTLLAGNIYDSRINVNISKGTATITSGAASVTVSDRAVKTASKIILTMSSDPNWVFTHTHTITVTGTASGLDIIGLGNGQATPIQGAFKSGTYSGPAANADASQVLWADTVVDGTSFKINAVQNVGSNTTVNYILIG